MGIAKFSDQNMILILDLQKAIDISDLIKIRTNHAA
jgi:hypothetical protein